MYDAPFSILWNYHYYLSPSATYRPIMWSVGSRNGDVKGLYHVNIFDNYAALSEHFLMLKPEFF